MTAEWSWLALAGLGAFHGINPAMGWLFAVALGLQRRSRAALLKSLVPIAAGHALSIAVVVAAVGLLRTLSVDMQHLRVASAIVLIGFGVYRFFARHRARGGMQVGNVQLLVWSFLMATAHGAGLMLLPVLLKMPIMAAGHDHAHHIADLPEATHPSMTAIAAVAVHTGAMLLVSGAIALAVYEWAGLAFLRRGWINLDLLWVLALVGAGVYLLAGALQWDSSLTRAGGAHRAAAESFLCRTRVPAGFRHRGHTAPRNAR